MKRMTAVLCALLLGVMAILGACGGSAKYADSKYVGKWNAVKAEYSGLEMDVKEILGGEFSFTLTPVDVDGNPLPNEGFQIASCAEGSAGTETVFSFPPLTYELSSYQDAEYHDTEGNALFYYLVEELTPEGAAEGVINGIIYSTEKYLVVVTLSYEDDELNAVWKTYPYDGNGVPETLRPINVYTTQA